MGNTYNASAWRASTHYLHQQYGRHCRTQARMGKRPLPYAAWLALRLTYNAA
jgi:hypothetical protein